LGFEKIIISKYNLSGKDKKNNAFKKFNIQIITMSKVEELYQYLF
jgi:hypothetical protein